MGRGRRGICSVDGGMVYEGGGFLSSGYHKRLEKQTNFSMQFHFIQVCTPVPNGSFLFRGFHPVLESQQIMSISDGQVSC